MRPFLLALALLPGVALAQEAAPPPEEPASTLVADFNFALGQKYLDDEDWGSTLDEQLTTGMETTWRKTGWNVGVAFDAMFGNVERRRGRFEEETITRGSTLEIATGLRAIVPLGRLRPYAGAGVELAQADLQVIRRNEQDDNAGAGGMGWWAGGGVFVRLGKTANVGLALRWSHAPVESGSFEANAGGWIGALTVGFGIPPIAD